MPSSTFGFASGPPVDSPAFWANPERIPVSGNPDQDTAQTIRIMAGHVGAAARDWLVGETAHQAVAMFAGLAGGQDTRAIAEACWWWAKVHIKFVHHEFILRRRLGEAGHLQGLISPEVLVRMSKPEGDCAIFSECIGAFLSVLGIPYEFVTVAASRQEPEEYSHVFVYAVMPDGRRFPLDASHGDYAGWQVPSSEVFRRQVWDANGFPVPDQGSRFQGLNGYGLRGREDANDFANSPFLGMGRLMGIARGLRGREDANDFANSPFLGMGRFHGMDDANDFAVSAWMGMGRRGMGDVCNPSDADYDANFCAAQQISVGTSTACTCTSSGTCAENGNSCVYLGGSPSTSTQITVPSQASSAWPAFASQLMKSGLTLAEIQSIPAGTIVNPSGQIIRQTAGYALPGSTGLPATVGGLSTTTLLIGGIVVIGGALLMSAGRR